MAAMTGAAHSTAERHPMRIMCGIIILIRVAHPPRRGGPAPETPDVRARPTPAGASRQNGAMPHPRTGDADDHQQLPTDLATALEHAQRATAQMSQMSQAQRLAGIGRWTWRVADGAVGPDARVRAMLGLDRDARPDAGRIVDLVHP